MFGLDDTRIAFWLPRAATEGELNELARYLIDNNDFLKNKVYYFAVRDGKAGIIFESKPWRNFVWAGDVWQEETNAPL